MPASIRTAYPILLSLLFLTANADNRVAVVAWADEAYTQRKFAHNPPRVETYVFMEGQLFQSFTRDDSLTRLPFRQIAEKLAVELARENYLPTTELNQADLLLAVHWGSTTPRVTTDELRGTTQIGVVADGPMGPQEMVEGRNPDDEASAFFVDSTERYREYAFDDAVRLQGEIDANFKTASNGRLLGYSRQMSRLSKQSVQTTAEQTMRFDMNTERYFIIVRAYDLKAPKIAGVPRRPVWTLHLNMRSPGQNFQTALARMSNVAVDFAGRSAEDMTTVRPKQRTGQVDIGPLKVLGVVED